MNINRTNARLTIKPIVTIKVLAFSLSLVGVVLLIFAGIICWVAIAVTKSPAIGLIAGLIAWLGGMMFFIIKMIYNLKGARYDFYSDRLVETIEGKSRAFEYKRMGHILYKDGQTFIISMAFTGTRPSPNVRIDVPREKGEHFFREIVSIIKNACPERLFSYERNGRVEYSVSTDIGDVVDIDPGQVQKLETLYTAPTYKEQDVMIDNMSEPAFTVLRPYNKGKGYYFHTLVLINKDPHSKAGRGKRSKGEVLLSLKGVDISKLSLGWNEYEIFNGQAVKIGRFRIKQKIISPVDDFYLEILKEKLHLRGDLIDHKYEISLNGAPVGKMTDPLFSLEKENIIEFDRPINTVIGASLILALNRGLFEDKHS